MGNTWEYLGTTGNAQGHGGRTLGDTKGTPTPAFMLSSPTGSALAELEQDWQEGSGGGGGSLHLFPLFPLKMGGAPSSHLPLTPYLPPDAPGQFSAAFQDGSYLALPGHLFPRG